MLLQIVGQAAQGLAGGLQIAQKPGQIAPVRGGRVHHLMEIPGGRGQIFQEWIHMVWSILCRSPETAVRFFSSGSTSDCSI